MAESNCYAKGIYGFNSAIGPSDIMNVEGFLHHLLKTPRSSMKCCSQTMAHLFVSICALLHAFVHWENVPLYIALIRYFCLSDIDAICRLQYLTVIRSSDIIIVIPWNLPTTGPSAHHILSCFHLVVPPLWKTANSISDSLQLTVLTSHLHLSPRPFDLYHPCD